MPTYSEPYGDGFSSPAPVRPMPNPSASQNRFAAVALAGFAGLLCTLVGCEEPAALEPTPPPPPPSPEVRFDRFMSELRRRVEGDGFTGTAIRGAKASLAGGYEVMSGKLVPPETSKGVYRAVVEIREQGSVTVLTPPADDEAPEGDGPVDPLAPPIEGLEELFPTDQPTTDPLVGPMTASPIETRAHSDTYRYELAYVDSRWRLKTEVDPKTFLAQAFKIALKRQ